MLRKALGVMEPFGGDFRGESGGARCEEGVGAIHPEGSDVFFVGGGRLVVSGEQALEAGAHFSEGLHGVIVGGVVESDDQVFAMVEAGVWNGGGFEFVD